MTPITDAEKDTFFRDVEAAAKKSIWCALATVTANHEPRVRMVHPTWEGDILWIATGPQTAKAREIQNNDAVDIQFQVAPPDFVHLLVRGRASVLQDKETRDRIWDVMDYDLAQFWPNGPSSPDFCVIRVAPSRVELSYMFGTTNQRVWKA